MSKGKKGWFNFIFEESSEIAPENTSEETVGKINVSNSEIVDIGIENKSLIDIPSSGDGVFDQKFFEFFQETISKNNIPGIDYFEYREALKKMTSLSESVKFQMAFDNFKIADPNLSKETLLSSIDHYNKILSEEEKDFDIEMELETEREVTSKRKEVKELISENNDIYQQIQNLNEKINQNQEKTIELNNQAALSELRIGQTAKNFIKTLANVRASLDTDKVKIVEMVQETKTA